MVVPTSTTCAESIVLGMPGIVMMNEGEVQLCIRISRANSQNYEFKK